MINNRIKALELAIATKPHRHEEVVPLATAFLEFIEGPCKAIGQDRARQNASYSED